MLQDITGEKNEIPVMIMFIILLIFTTIAIFHNLDKKMHRKPNTDNIDELFALEQTDIAICLMEDSVQLIL
jgi:hypothetical protein